ncbi:hypothetical protein PQG02_17140 [Nostoc sp. UHCC 0926]|uniref:hypothetical protein n=1 Tax=unclassified Nostoc TaxID=2593658 RepID=UPI00235E3915|nr:hypothetical protein [Nostoc sp. UHCC 0926]WDD30497.1 hypothetical protein PQG02_17140 [Nostoc sp. UHCC 0926]
MNVDAGGGLRQGNEIQQTMKNVGFRSSNATCFKSGNRIALGVSPWEKGAVAPQPTQVRFLAFTQAYWSLDD